MTQNPSIIQDLMNPAALPDKTEQVALVQTHISVVFVADEYVYKMKKAVNFGFLDFSTLDKRRYYCNQEILLNRRLSKDLYVDVLPITFDGQRHKMGQHRGEVVDYAVKMKRIPDEMLMKSVFDRGALTVEHLQEIARVLAEFHLTAQRSPEIDAFGLPERFKINTDENFDQTEKYIGSTISQRDFESLLQWTNNYLVDNRPLFHERIAAGKIRDCHGDLHMEHVCLQDPISIIDCIEFNDRMRYSDTIADIAFLLMDLEYRGGKDFADQLWNLYSELAGERDVSSLLTFYKVYRAYVRGKVNSFQLDDEQIGPDEREAAIETARNYFRFARSYIE